MKKPAATALPAYIRTLKLLSTGETGLAFIEARNGLMEAEKIQDASGLFVFQSLFARVHLEDGDADSARRACKLMKIHLAKAPADDQSWGEAELAHLNELIEAMS